MSFPRPSDEQPCSGADTQRAIDELERQAVAVFAEPEPARTGFRESAPQFGHAVQQLSQADGGAAIHPSFSSSGLPFFVAIERTRVAMVLTDPNLPDNPIVFANPAFVKLCGYPPWQITGRNCRFLQGPETNRAEVARIGRALTERRDIVAEILNYRADGSSFWNEVFISPVYDADGKLIYFFASQLDVTRRREAEVTKAALANREEKLSLIIDGASDYAIITLEDDGRIVSWSSGAAAIFGWTAEQIVGRSMSILLTPEDCAAGVDQSSLETAEREGVEIAERWYLTRGGERRFMVGTMRRLHGPNGKPSGFLKVARDRTDQYRVEQALRSSEAQFRTLAEALPNLVWAADRDGLITYFNRRLLDYSGLQFSAVEGKQWVIITHPDDLARVTAAWSRARSAGSVYEAELRLRNAEGEYRWFVVRAEPIYGEAGRIVNWIGASADIHDRKLAEAELKRLALSLAEEVKARTGERDRIWRLSTNLLIVADRKGTAIATNPAWFALLGRDEEGLLGKSFFECVHPDDRSATEAAFGGLAEGQTLSDFENRCCHVDGSFRWVTWSAGADTGLLYATGRDVTEEKQQAEQRDRLQEQLRQSQKMEAVGQLTGGIAHDFNNLLTGISGSLDMVKMLLEQKRFDELDRYTDVAQAAATRAASLTHRLLAFSRRQRLDPKPIQIDQLIAGMEELIRRSVGPAVAVEIIETAGLWQAVADPNQLENALLNLCINARDAMPEGGRITIEASNRQLEGSLARERELPDGHYLVITVSDTGTGMTPEVAAMAFDPFFTTKPPGQGTGLGLSMICGFARQSGGHVGISSEPGRGAAVSIILPRYYGARRSPGVQSAERSPVPALTGETILIVDDEPVVRMLVGDALREIGCRSLDAATGAAALELLRSQTKIDLLVTDVGLPGGMDGRQVADAARTLRPGLKVLFITGYAETAVISKDILDRGMAIMTKPFAIAALGARVRATLQQV